MSMTAAGMKSAIVSKLQSATINSASDAQTAWADALNGYIADNCAVIGSWVGVNPSTSAPDPVVTWTGKISFSSFSLSPVSSFAAWMAEIVVQITGGTINPDDSTFSLTPMHPMTTTFSSSQSGATSFEDAVLAVCTDIVSGISLMIGATATGSHGAFTGTAVVTTLT